MSKARSTKKRLARHLGRVVKWLKIRETGDTRQNELRKIHREELNDYEGA